MKFSRRNFIKTTGAGVIAAGMPAIVSGTAPVNSASPAAEDAFSLAVAGYTFAKINLDDSLAMMKRVGVKYLGLKDFHLPLTSTKEVIDADTGKNEIIWR